MLDVYVRLSVMEAERLAPRHLYSALDDDAPCDMATPTLQGVTEWVADGPRTLSFGWDWSAPIDIGLVAHWSSLRTNLMLVDEAGVDLDAAATRACVARVMERCGWQRDVVRILDLSSAA